MEVNLNTEPLQQLYDEVDTMSQGDAINHINKALSATVSFRNRYEQLMVATPYGTKEWLGYKHAWEVDLSNIIKMLKLRAEIEAEE